RGRSDGVAIAINEVCGAAAWSAAVVGDLKRLVIWPAKGNLARIAIGDLRLPAGGIRDLVFVVGAGIDGEADAWRIGGRGRGRGSGGRGRRIRGGGAAAGGQREQADEQGHETDLVTHKTPHKANSIIPQY